MEKYIRRIEEIALILGMLTEDLKEAVGELKKALMEKPVEEKGEAGGGEEQSIEAIKEKPLTIEKVQSMLPENLLSKVYFKDAGESIVVRPREYLGHDVFREIVRVVCDGLGGTYISAGRNSRFVIPKEKHAI